MTKYEKRIYEMINQSSSHMTVEQIYQDIDALKNIGGTYWIDLY